LVHADRERLHPDRFAREPGAERVELDARERDAEGLQELGDLILRRRGDDVLAARRALV
jgi:hypothetical protein